MKSHLRGEISALRLHASHLNAMRNTGVVLAALAVGLLLAWAMPSLPGARGVANYLPLHTLLETIAIVIAVLVFSVGWNAKVERLSGSILILSCAFIGVALLDFSHVLSYAGMPEFVTPSSPEKSINFWLAARLLAAVALLVFAVAPWRPLLSKALRHYLLTAVLALTAATYWLFLFHAELLPETFIPGKGLTTFKVISEYLIIAINLVSALALWLRMNKPQQFNVAAMFGAVCTMAMSEFFFTLYADVTDIFNVLGHLYKVISYLFIYRAIFVAAIDDPYRRLGASQNQLQATLDALPDLLFELDLEGRYHAYHAPRSGFASKSGAEFVGKSLHDMLPSLAAASLMSALRKASVTGNAGGDYQLELPQGKRWFEFSVVKKSDDAGQEPRFIVLSRDVTERRQIEERNSRLTERLELATRSARIGIWDWDVVSNTLGWDKLMYELYGVKQAEFGGVYEAWRSALHPDDMTHADEAMQLALRGEKTYDAEFRAQWKDGTIHHIQAHGIVVRDAQNTPLRMVGINYDITEKKRAEETLRQLNEELEQRVEQRTAAMKISMEAAERANVAKSDFLSRMSHELRTPLNAILGFGQLLESDPQQPLTADQADNVHEILEAGRHLLELINEVLDLSRIESGRLELSIEALPVAALIEQCMAQIQPMAAQRGIGVTLEADAAAVLQADRMRIKEVLLNLLSNAVKYNRPGGSIHVSCTPAGEQRLRISVRDSGRGIPADALPRLFRPFERLESSYDGIEGTGIGLALAKMLTQAMDGSIGVDSVVGQGSSFWVEFPLAAAGPAQPSGKQKVH